MNAQTHYPADSWVCLRTRFTSIHKKEILRENTDLMVFAPVSSLNVRCVKTIIELLIVYEIFHKTNLYDLCFEILLTTRLEKILVGKFR